MNEKAQALPPLSQVLSGNSQSPVDLDSFYAFMRQNYSGVQYLTFWVDAAKHLALCRDYVRSNLDIGDSNTRSRYRSGPSDDASLYRSGSPNSSILFNVLQHGVQGSEDERRRTQSTWRDTRSSMRMGDARAGRDDPNLTGSSGQFTSHNTSSNRDSNRDSNRQSHISNRDSGTSGHSRVDTPTRVSMYLNQHQNQNQPREINLQQLEAGNLEARNPDDEQRYYDAQELPNGAESPPLLGHSRAGSHTVTRDDIYTNVDRLVEKYLSPDSLFAIVLPGEMASSIRTASQGRGKDNPSLFEEAREYVFAALEREAYPAFLNQRALSNVQPDVSVVRLVLGLLGLFAGFWLGFAGILLDWARTTRCFVIIPFAIGWYLVLSSLYNIDAVLGLAARTESIQKSPPQLDRIDDLYIRQLMRKRALFVALITLLVAASWCVLFIFVPGHHL